MSISKITGASIEDGSITLADLGITTIDAGTGNTLTLQANSATGITIDVTGNTAIANTLSFTGTGARIRGDFSNATVANRVAFQTSTANNNTVAAVLPTGTGTVAAFQFFNNSDPTNAAYIEIGSRTSGTEARVTSGIYGTGTYLPMTFYTGGSERLRIDTSGNVGIGTNNPSVKLNVYDSSADTVAYFDSANVNGPHFRFLNSGVSKSFIGQAPGFLTSGTSADDLGIRATGSLVFGTNGNNIRMAISSAGNVGIGTTSPSQKLHVAAGTILSSNTAGTIATVSIAGNGSTVGTSDFALQQGTSSEAYVYNRANSFLVIGTNNTERMRIDSAGRVAIGPIASAGYTVGTLMVGDTTNSGASASIGLFGKRITEDQISSDINFYNNSTTSIAYIYALRGSSDTAAGKLTFGTGGSERMRIASNGNVGIGTSNPLYQLQISTGGADVSIGGAPTANGTGRLKFINSNSNINWQISTNDTVGAALEFIPSTTAGGSTFTTPAMLITSGGNVGIGTSSPGARLHAAGGAIIVDNDWSFGFGSTRSTQIVGSSSTNFMRFETSGTERMRIDSAGDVGIGTTNPVYQLHIQSGDPRIALTNTTYGEWFTSAGWTGANDYSIVQAGTAERMRLDSSGNLRFNSGYGSVATAYGCRAWVNFNGTTASPSTIRASGNVSSVTKNGTGDYTINFSSALPDANYSISGLANRNITGNYGQYVCAPWNQAQTTTTCRIATIAYDGNFWDCIQVTFKVVR